MQELFYINSIKLLLSFTCYGGTLMVYVNAQLDQHLTEILRVSPRTQVFVVWLLMIFWIIKIIWYVIDKWLEYQERIQDLKNKENDGKK